MRWTLDGPSLVCQESGMEIPIFFSKFFKVFDSSYEGVFRKGQQLRRKGQQTHQWGLGVNHMFTFFWAICVNCKACTSLLVSGILEILAKVSLKKSSVSLLLFNTTNLIFSTAQQIPYNTQSVQFENQLFYCMRSWKKKSKWWLLGQHNSNDQSNLPIISHDNDHQTCNSQH
jgi:hypothetical protein